MAGGVARVVGRDAHAIRPARIQRGDRGRDGHHDLSLREQLPQLRQEGREHEGIAKQQMMSDEYPGRPARRSAPAGRTGERQECARQDCQARANAASSR